MKTIYRITHIESQTHYIGQTTDPVKRWINHKDAAMSDGRYKQRIAGGMRLLGIKKFEFVVIEEVEDAVADSREQHWINHYDSFKNGWNQTQTGKGTKGRQRIKWRTPKEAKAFRAKLGIDY